MVFCINSALAENAGTIGYGTPPVLITKLIKLPSKSTVTEIAGSVNIGVRNVSKRDKPLVIGDVIDETKIIFMARYSHVILISSEGKITNLSTTESSKTYTFE